MEPHKAAPRLHGRHGASWRAALGGGHSHPRRNLAGSSSRAPGPLTGSTVAAEEACSAAPELLPMRPTRWPAGEVAPRAGRAQEPPTQDTGVGRAGDGQGHPSLSLGQGCPPTLARPAETLRRGLQQGRGTRYLVELFDPPDQVRIAEEFSKQASLQRGAGESMSAAAGALTCPRVLGLVWGGGAEAGSLLQAGVHSPPPGTSSQCGGTWVRSGVAPETSAQGRAARSFHPTPRTPVPPWANHHLPGKSECAGRGPDCRGAEETGYAGERGPRPQVRANSLTEARFPQNPGVGAGRPAVDQRGLPERPRTAAQLPARRGASLLPRAPAGEGCPADSAEACTRPAAPGWTVHSQGVAAGVTPSALAGGGWPRGGRTLSHASLFSEAAFTARPQINHLSSH